MALLMSSVVDGWLSDDCYTELFIAGNEIFKTESEGKIKKKIGCEKENWNTEEKSIAKVAYNLWYDL